MKTFAKGLVVGKFAPLHYGHERLLQAAMAQCAELFVISYSLPEMPGCEPDKRSRWLQSRFPDIHHLVVTPELARQWNVPPVPHNDADEELHRCFVADLCLEVFGTTIDAVFTAEDYGDGFAAVLQREFRQYTGKMTPVVHVRLNRQEEPIISGTMLRENIHKYRRYLAPSVYADFVYRICLLGGESSGKSTLTKALAQALDAPYVAEYGRELWEERAGKLAFEDMVQIAHVQIEREEQYCAGPRLVCDTTPLTTLFYSQSLFGKADPILEELAGRRYDTTILCAPDFPFVQDGTRQNVAFRQEQHEWYQAQLSSRGIAYLEVRGSVGERVDAIFGYLQHNSK